MASDLCIIYNNAADTATISASTTSGTTSANNLKTDNKGTIHKSTGSTVSYTLTWGTGQRVGAIAFPATNLPSTATVTITINSVEVFAPTAIFLYTDIGEWPGTATVSEFPFGRYTSGYIILDQVYTNVTSCIIGINNSTAGTQIECARLVVGDLWQPNRYASNGIKMERKDTSTVARINTGNVSIDRGYQYDTMSFDIKYMEETDRQNLFAVLRKVGSHKNVFITVFPSFTNRLKNDYSIYGRIASSPITYDIYNIYSYTVNIDGW